MRSRNSYEIIRAIGVRNSLLTGPAVEPCDFGDLVFPRSRSLVLNTQINLQVFSRLAGDGH